MMIFRLTGSLGLVSVCAVKVFCHIDSHGDCTQFEIFDTDTAGPTFHRTALDHTSDAGKPIKTLSGKHGM